MVIQIDLIINHIIKKLKNQDEDLQNTIIYLEDPIGKYKYEHNPEFANSIVDITESLRDLNIYLVISSREEIYQQFHPIGGLDAITKKFVKKLNIGKRSYDYARRKEMLLRWAAIYRCEWLEDEGLKNEVFDIIEKNDAKLPTPLNIKNFAYATRYDSDVARNGEELLRILDKTSQRTPEVFAQEIKAMSQDKMIFLSFPFISDRFSVEFVKATYQQLVRELKIEEDAWEFDKVTEWFKDDKIDIINDPFHHNEWTVSGWPLGPEKDIIRFSHPSYSEAILYAISENGTLTKAGKTLISILLKLADYKGYAVISDVVEAVSNNFDKLPENVRNELLVKLAEKKEAAWPVTDSIDNNFDKIRENIRNEILRQLKKE